MIQGGEGEGVRGEKRRGMLAREEERGGGEGGQEGRAWGLGRGGEEQQQEDNGRRGAGVAWKEEEGGGGDAGGGGREAAHAQQLGSWVSKASRESGKSWGTQATHERADPTQELRKAEQQGWGTREDSRDIRQHPRESWGGARRTPEAGQETNPGSVAATERAARDSGRDSTLLAAEREAIRLGALESAGRGSPNSRSSWVGASSGQREGAGGDASSMSSGAPCGACKFLRRKCVRGCIFAPYFGAEQGAARFAAVHKIFGASNVAKLLLHIPLPRRCDAVLTISYEAQARLSDPVYGCVATIFALQQQVASLQAELAMVQAQLANRDAAAQIQQQQHHQHHHHLQQQHQQIGTMSPGSAVASPAYMQQQQQQHEHTQLSPSDISMSIPSGSGSHGHGSYSRVKAEDGNSFLGMHYDHMGMGSGSLDEPLSANQHSLLDSMHKPRSGESLEQSGHDGELQVLASFLQRK